MIAVAYIMFMYAQLFEPLGVGFEVVFLSMAMIILNIELIQ